MDSVVSFFRDTLSGWIYFVYVFVCLILMLSIVGKLGDKKKKEIQEQKRAKKKYELESGEAALKASMEGKQVINVLDTTPAPAEIAQTSAQVLDAAVVVSDSVSIVEPESDSQEVVSIEPSLGNVIQNNVVEAEQAATPDNKEEINTLVLNSDDSAK